MNKPTPEELARFNHAINESRRFYIKKIAGVLSEPKSIGKADERGWKRGRAMALSDLLVTLLYTDLANSSEIGVRDKACELINASLIRVGKIHES